MLGLMQDWPLSSTASSITRRSSTGTGGGVPLDRGPIHRTTYADPPARPRVANGWRWTAWPGDRVATLAWNTWRHLEAWYGITGIGAVYHTVNPRLFEDQIVYIVNHADDRILFLDLTFVPLIEKLPARLPVERFVVLTDGAHMPATRLSNAVAFEDWLAEVDDDFAWAGSTRTRPPACATPPARPASRRASSIRTARTSCTRSSASVADCFGLSARDVAMPVVPLSTPTAGRSRSRRPWPAPPGVARPEARRRLRSISSWRKKGVTITAACRRCGSRSASPGDDGGKLRRLKRVVIGGSACPRAMTEAFETKYGVTVSHAWGMTEMSPLGSFCSVKPDLRPCGRGAARPEDEAGHPPFGVEFRITDDADATCRGTARPSGA